MSFQQEVGGQTRGVHVPWPCGRLALGRAWLQEAGLGASTAGAVLALTAPPRDSANSREGTVNWGFSLLYPFWLNMPGVVTAHHRIMQNNNMCVNKMMMS